MRKIHKILLSVVILSFFLILNTSPIHALVTKELYNDWAESSTNIIAGSKNFSVIANKNQDGVSLISTVFSTLLDNGTCVDKENLYLCLSDYRFKGYNQALDRAVNEYHIIISEKLAEIEIIRGFEKTDFQIGETISVKTSIQNIGDYPATNINFSDSFTNLTIIKAVGLNNLPHKVYWKGSLDPNEKKEFVYWFTAVGKADFDSVAIAEYISSDNPLISKSDLIRIVVPDYEMGLFTNLTETNISIDDYAGYFMNVSNMDETYEILVTLRLKISPGIKVYYNDTFREIEDYVYQASIVLDPGTYWNYTVLVKPETTGKKKLSLSGIYQLSNIMRYRDFNSSFNSTVEEVSLDLFMENKTMTSGKPSNIRVAVSQPGSKHNFRKIKVVMKSSYPELNLEKEFDELNKKSFIDVVSKDIIPGGVTSEIGHYLNITVVYRTEYGESFNFTKDFNFTVIPSPVFVINEEVVTGEESEPRPFEGGKISETLQEKINFVVKLVFIFLGVLFGYVLIHITVSKTISRNKRLKLEKNEVESIQNDLDEGKKDKAPIFRKKKVKVEKDDADSHGIMGDDEPEQVEKKVKSSKNEKKAEDVDFGDSSSSFKF